MDNNSKQQKKRIVIIAGVALVILFILLQILLKDSINNSILTKTAAEITEKCPMDVDSITRLDNAVALEGNVLQFNYTITNANQSNYDTLALQEAVRPLALASLKDDPKNKVFRDNNVTLSFVYHDKDGSYLCTISVNSNDTD